MWQRHAPVRSCHLKAPLHELRQRIAPIRIRAHPWTRLNKATRQAINCRPRERNPQIVATVRQCGGTAPACAHRRSLAYIFGTRFFSVHDNSSFGAASRAGTRGNVMRQPSRTMSLFALVALVCLPALAAQAEDYPTKPVKWVVAYPPGGTTDILARIMGQALSERLGQQFVIDNRPGAGNNIGTEAGGELSPRRLHDPARQSGERHQRDALQAAAVQLPARHRARRRHHARSERHGNQSQLPGEDGSPNSSPMPRRTPARSTWPRRATGPRCISPASSSWR